MIFFEVFSFGFQVLNIKKLQYRDYLLLLRLIYYVIYFFKDLNYIYNVFLIMRHISQIQKKLFSPSLGIYIYPPFFLIDIYLLLLSRSLQANLLEVHLHVATYLII